MCDKCPGDNTDLGVDCHTILTAFYLSFVSSFKSGIASGLHSAALCRTAARPRLSNGGGKMLLLYTWAFSSLSPKRPYSVAVYFGLFYN